ncbi:histidine kinase [Methylobacterium sp. Leaf399]|uniref:response regulator n=1 Tax=unclassified Methylobacterium TaxID=2615210 RepID=UPI0006F3CE4A|nr:MULTISPECIES: response regulator [unclassified Methylobacterium]KQP61466.1 histidine kinase [Methylobacterium sp. Leaf108]KQT19616.1 histidine kinase [Methylobacterium sp. Leaf399]
MSTAPLVVVADDDTITRSIINLKLKSRGYTVITASDGSEALRIIEAENPALVVLDAMMPGINGFELLRQIKSTPKTADTLVVMLTSRKLEQDIVGALNAGASDYLVKPFIPEELAVRIARLLPIGRPQ